MSGIQSLIPFEPDAYDAIARAMEESERGRWFLAEHARRNRGPDTEMLLGAIARLESAVTAQRPPEEMGELRGNLLDMARAISRTKAEIAAISPADPDQSRLGVASETLDAIVRTTERATSDILGAAEEVQEAAWTLRERGIEPALCDSLDRHATQIYTACSFQDLTAQRIVRIVNTLRYLETRLTAMIAIWDGDGEPVPAPPGAAAPDPVDLSQTDVDRFIEMDRPSPTIADPALDAALDFAAIPEAGPAPEFEAVEEGADLAWAVPEGTVAPEPLAEMPTETIGFDAEDGAVAELVLDPASDIDAMTANAALQALAQPDATFAFASDAAEAVALAHDSVLDIVNTAEADLGVLWNVDTREEEAGGLQVPEAIPAPHRPPSSEFATASDMTEWPEVSAASEFPAVPESPESHDAAALRDAIEPDAMAAHEVPAGPAAFEAPEPTTRPASEALPAPEPVARAEFETAPEGAPRPPSRADARDLTFVDIDLLSIEEKLALFS